MQFVVLVGKGYFGFLVYLEYMFIGGMLGWFRVYGDVKQKYVRELQSLEGILINIVSKKVIMRFVDGEY